MSRRPRRPAPSNNRRIFIFGGIGVGLVACLALVGGLAYFTYTLPPVSEQLPLGTSPIIVNLTVPFANDTVPISNYTDIHAEAIGPNPIQVMTLWVNGMAVDAHAASAKGNSYGVDFSWQPTGPGEQVLVVRAQDANGQLGNSNLLRVQAFDPAPILMNVPVSETDTVQSVADAFDMTVPQVVALNPQITTAADQPLPAGTTLTVLPPSGGPVLKPPVPAIPPDTSLIIPPPQVSTGAGAVPTTAAPAGAPPAGPVVTINPGTVAVAPKLDPNNKLGTFIDLKVKPIVNSSNPPTAPELAVVVEGCTATLYLFDKSDNEAGFAVYKMEPGASAFAPIKSLAAHSGTETASVTDTAGYGNTQYYISAFNADGEAPSNFVQATVLTETCLQPNQQGLGLQKPEMKPAVPVEKAMCFVVVNGSRSVRVPAIPGDYVYPVNGVFDFSEVLNILVSPPPTTDTTLTMRCAGWNGGDLVDLGEDTQTLSPGQNKPFTLKGEGFTVTATLNFGQTTVPPVIPPAPPLPPPVAGQEIAPPYDFVMTQNNATQENILLWRWSPVTCPADVNGQPPADCQYINDIAGYKVYQDGAVVGTLTPDQKILTLSATPGPTQCYRVVAYKDAAQSLPSPFQCVQAVQPKPLPSADLPVPVQVHFTNDLAECLAHAGAGADLLKGLCQQAADGQAAVLVWDLSGPACQPGTAGCTAIADVDGYQIYESRDGLAYLRASVTPATTTLAQLPVLAACYSVFAFKGNMASYGTTSACVPPELARAQTEIRVPPTFGSAFGSYANAQTCDPATSLQVDMPDGGRYLDYADFGFAVGYIHSYEADPCQKSSALWREGEVAFELPNDPVLNIQKATLQFQVSALQYNNAQGGGPASGECATEIDLAHGVAAGQVKRDGQVVKTLNGGMWAGHDQVAVAPFGANGQVDVTAAVKAAIADKRLLDLIFLTDTTGDPRSSATCLAHYHAFKLVVNLAP
jgi:hypothetical protein